MPVKKKKKKVYRWPPLRWLQRLPVEPSWRGAPAGVPGTEQFLNQTSASSPVLHGTSVRRALRHPSPSIKRQTSKRHQVLWHFSPRSTVNGSSLALAALIPSPSFTLAPHPIRSSHHCHFN